MGSILIDLTAKRTADLIQTAAQSKAAPGSENRMIGDYYASFMDSTAIDAAGLSPLKPTLDSIAAIHDRKSLATFLGSTLRADVDGFNATNFYTEHLLGLWVAQDLDDPAHYSPFLLQGGLGMPDRSYYVDPSSAMATIRDKYKAYIAAMLNLAKIPDAQARADAIMRIETKIATAHVSREVSGDVTKATITGRGPSSGPRRRASIGRRISPRRDSGRRRALSCGSRPPSPAFPLSPRASRSMHGRVISPFTPSTITPPSSRTCSANSRSPSTGRC